MSVKTITLVFDEYQKNRLHFATTVADLADRHHLIDCLRSFRAVELLIPLLNDPVGKVQQNACVALGRILAAGGEVIQEALNFNVIQHFLTNFEKKTKYYKKGAMMGLKGIAKHSENMACVVVNQGGLDAALTCLEDFDVGVKESGAWVIASIARHSEKMASKIAALGAISLLKLCLQEPEICLKQVAVVTLTDIAKHSIQLATVVIDNGCLPLIIKCLSIEDAKLKKLVLCSLSHIASQSEELAETVIIGDAFPQGLYHMAHPDQNVRAAAASLTKEIVKHSFQMATWLVNSGVVTGLLEAISSSDSNVQLPAVMALGYIASHAENLAMIIITSEGINIFKPLLTDSKDDSLLSVLVWMLGHIGKYTSEHTKALADNTIYNDILNIYVRENISEELKQKCKRTLKQILAKCTHTPALEPLLHIAPPEIIKYVLAQFSKVLPNDAAARRMFVTSGCLEKMQLLNPVPGSSLFEYVSIINHCYPDEIIRYYSPGYGEALLDQIEQYSPEIPPIFQDNVSICSVEDGGDTDIEIPVKIC